MLILKFPKWTSRLTWSSHIVAKFSLLGSLLKFLARLFFVFTNNLYKVRPRSLFKTLWWEQNHRALDTPIWRTIAQILSKKSPKLKSNTRIYNLISSPQFTCFYLKAQWLCVVAAWSRIKVTIKLEIIKQCQVLFNLTLYLKH